MRTNIATFGILDAKMKSKNPLVATMTANDVILITDVEKTFECEFMFNPDSDDLNAVSIVHEGVTYDADCETKVDMKGNVSCTIHSLYELGGEILTDVHCYELKL